MVPIHAFLSSSIDSIRLSHGAWWPFLPFHTVSSLADSLPEPLILLYHLPWKFWIFSFHAMWARPFSRLPKPILMGDQQLLPSLAKSCDLQLLTLPSPTLGSVFSRHLLCHSPVILLPQGHPHRLPISHRTRVRF